MGVGVVISSPAKRSVLLTASSSRQLFAHRAGIFVSDTTKHDQARASHCSPLSSIAARRACSTLVACTQPRGGGCSTTSPSPAAAAAATPTGASNILKGAEAGGIHLRNICASSFFKMAPSIVYTTNQSGFLINLHAAVYTQHRSVTHNFC